MILPACHAEGAASSVDLGQASPLKRAEASRIPTRERARWNLTPTAVQRLERARDGGDLTLHITPEVVILNHGEPVQDVDQPPAGTAPPSVRPQPGAAAGIPGSTKRVYRPLTAALR